VRAQISSALKAGYSEKQILDGMVAAHGERILAKPKATGFNLMAWILPALALLFGGVAAWRYLAHAHAKTSPPPVSKASVDENYDQRIERELEELDS
jgi:cytochrome c-type biogenesis protein CcmH